MIDDIIIKERILCFKNQYKEEDKNNKMFFERMIKNKERILTEKDLENYNNFLESLNSQVEIIRDIKDLETVGEIDEI